VGVVDDEGREREKYILPSGAKLHVESGQVIKKGQILAEWDPFNEPFVTDVPGTVRFTDIIEGKTFQEKVDETTMRATQTIIEYRTTNFGPPSPSAGRTGTPAGAHPRRCTPCRWGILMVRGARAGRRHHRRKPRETSKTKESSAAFPAWPTFES
jgi:DNA-directed RNA polymerase subunit beta'